jgi:hypothetical protein
MRYQLKLFSQISNDSTNDNRPNSSNRNTNSVGSPDSAKALEKLRTTKSSGDGQGDSQIDSLSHSQSDTALSRLSKVTARLVYIENTFRFVWIQWRARAYYWSAVQLARDLLFACVVLLFPTGFQQMIAQILLLTIYGRQPKLYVNSGD